MNQLTVEIKYGSQVKIIDVSDLVWADHQQIMTEVDKGLLDQAEQLLEEIKTVPIVTRSQEDGMEIQTRVEEMLGDLIDFATTHLVSVRTKYQGEIDRWREDAAHSDELIARLRAEYVDLGLKVTSLNNQIAEYNNTIVAQAQSIQALERRCETEAESHAATKAILVQAKDRIGELERKLGVLQVEYNIAQKELEHWKNMHDEMPGEPGTPIFVASGVRPGEIGGYIVSRFDGYHYSAREVADLLNRLFAPNDLVIEQYAELSHKPFIILEPATAQIPVFSVAKIMPQHVDSYIISRFDGYDYPAREIADLLNRYHASNNSIGEQADKLKVELEKAQEEIDSLRESNEDLARQTEGLIAKINDLGTIYNKRLKLHESDLHDIESAIRAIKKARFESKKKGE